MKTVYERRDETLDLVVDELRGRYRAVSLHKVEGGVTNFIAWYDTYVLDKIKRDALTQRLTFSPRPYQAGQACDGTVDAGALALFILCCEALGLDPEDIYAAAYDGEPLCKGEVLAFARWQGLSVPAKWDEKTVERMCEGLHAVNNHYLAQIFEETRTKC